MRSIVFAAGIAALASSASLHPTSAVAADCAIERAVYRPLGGRNPDAEKTFELTHSARRIPANQSQLVATIRDTATKRFHYFGFAFSNGYGRTHLVYAGPDKSGGKPDGGEVNTDGPGSPVVYFDAKLGMVDAPVKAGEPAPDYLIMPEIGLNFWYSGPSDHSFIPPDGLWKRAACR